MIALGWWFDQCVTAAAGATTGLDAIPGRTQAVAAVALAWAVMLGAISLVFRRAGVADGGSNALPHSLHYEGIGLRIHDGPAQMLTYVILRLDELEEMLQDTEGSSQPVPRQIVQDVKSASIDALNDLRQISRQLARQA
ncbi:histidine kinase [Mesorhizobium sp. B2-4-13]|uniref:histidine kinase n=1 Tax=Mesorhizobium sp. B2-4-13 TaxID=2589936 RepID=UPI0015EF3472|nr:histidine kinase [Mesorhizobium sp. B2-4-13]